MSLALAGYSLAADAVQKRGCIPHYWKCIQDPSEDGLFRGNLFTLQMIRAGGFDDGTVFEHVRTGERRGWQGGQLVSWS